MEQSTVNVPSRNLGIDLGDLESTECASVIAALDPSDPPHAPEPHELDPECE